MEEEGPRDKIVKILKKLIKNGLTTISGGNISIKSGDSIYITPKGIDKGNLQQDDIVYTTDGKIWKGKFSPSTEYPFHCIMYVFLFKIVMRHVVILKQLFIHILLH